jgi:hypothetical protein
MRASAAPVLKKRVRLFPDESGSVRESVYGLSGARSYRVTKTSPYFADSE